MPSISRTLQSASARVLLQVWLFLGSLVVAFGGGAVLLAVARQSGLYISPRIAGLAAGTFDYLTMLFLVLWTWTLQLLSVNDGRDYRLELRRVRVARSGASDVLIPAVFAVIAIGWGLLGVHPVYTARASEARYLGDAPSGTTTAMLEQGADVVTTIYFLVSGVVFVVLLIARALCPVDLGDYERSLRRLLPVARTSSNNHV